MNASVKNPVHQPFSALDAAFVLPIDSSNKLTIAEQVIDYARWAPSGDNTQPWRFRLINNCQFMIEASDTRSHCVYDLDGHSSHLAHGILLETIHIAAKYLGFSAQFTINDHDLLTIEVNLNALENTDYGELKTNKHLFSCIKTRSVQRKPMGTDSLTLAEKNALTNALPEGFTIVFYESFREKLACAKLNYINAKTRLTMKEAFDVHRKIIEWHSQYSETKIPEQALGVDWLTARAMQWMFDSWQRVKFANKYLGATILPRIMLDFIPGIKSSAHFVIYANDEPKSVKDYLLAGQTVQRFWLTVAQLNLGLQPSQTSIIFAKYIRNHIVFTTDYKVMNNAVIAKDTLDAIVPHAERAVFIGRLGRTKPPHSRSLRKKLSDLIINE